MPTPYWHGCRALTCTCTERSGFSHRGRHARRSACGSSLSSYPAGSPRTRRFSRDYPYRATDARQVAGDACPNPVGSRASGNSPATLEAELLSRLSHAKLHAPRGVGHLSPLEAPDVLARLIADFVAE